MLQQKTVSGIVFNDTNGNGTQDSGRTRVGGVPISLLDDGGRSRIHPEHVGERDLSVLQRDPRRLYPSGNLPLGLHRHHGVNGCRNRFVRHRGRGQLRNSAGGPPDHVTLSGPAFAEPEQVSTAFASPAATPMTMRVTSRRIPCLISPARPVPAPFNGDAAGGTEITRVTLDNGTNTAQFYYRDSSPGTPRVTGRKRGRLDLGAAAHSITIKDNRPTATAATDLTETGLRPTGMPRPPAPATPIIGWTWPWTGNLRRSLRGSTTRMWAGSPPTLFQGSQRPWITITGPGR